jgi:hypothetical membrane protein
MNRPLRSLTSFCLLAAAATPVINFHALLVAVPFYPGYSFSSHSISMLGTRFSRHPWIFNTGEILTGLAALAGAFGLFQAFRAKTRFLPSLMIALSVAIAGVMTLKAGMFPMPDPRHNCWPLLFNVIILIPFLMLIALLNRRGILRTYLICSIGLMMVLIPFKARLGPGTLQLLIAVATLLPIGVLGFFFWLEMRQSLPDQK